MTTTAELIEMLLQLPPDAVVQVEGCDCINEATQAIMYGKDVLIGSDVWDTEVESPRPDKGALD